MRDSSSCLSTFNCPYTWNRRPLQSAINVELQRGNSRMVLERTPIQEHLLESDVVKCELAVSKKKEEAIESLRLIRSMPTRIQEEIKMGGEKKKIKIGSRCRDSAAQYSNGSPKS